jgi:glycosyltransferase 2 family protein
MSSAAQTPTRSKRRALILAATLAAAAYVGASLALDSRQIAASIGRLGWLGCGAVLALSLLNYGLRFERWRMILAQLGHRVPAVRHLLYYLSGFAFTVSPAKAGEAVRSLYLRDHGVSYAESVAALFAERSLDVLAMVVLATLVIVSRLSYLPVVIAVLLAMAGCLLLVSRKSLPQRLGVWAEGLQRPIAKRLARAALVLLESARALLRPRLLLLGAAIGIISWGGEGLGLYLLCRSLHVQVAPLTAIGIYGLAVLAGGVAFFLPAGIGSMEAVMTALLTAQGASVGAALTITLLCRVATLWFAVVIGVVAAACVELQPGFERLPLAP